MRADGRADPGVRSNGTRHENGVSMQWMTDLSAARPRLASPRMT
jgi:hypothetical protein